MDAHLRGALLTVAFRRPRSAVDFEQSVLLFADSEQHPQAQTDALRKDAAKLTSLRRAYAQALDGALTEGALDDLYKYYTHLTFAASKLPDELGPQFVYASSLAGVEGSDDHIPGALGAATSALSAQTSSSLQYERASVLFDIGAAHLGLGGPVGWDRPEDVKQALQHQQQAAGCFEALRAHLAEAVEEAVAADLTAGCLDALERLCLAQAQECVLHKSIAGNLSDSVVARISMETSRLYASALPSCQDLRKSVRADAVDHWIALGRLKEGHYAAVAHFMKSRDDTAHNRHGSEVARLQESVRLLELAISSGRGAPGELVKSAEAFLLRLKGILKRAAKDNDLIYLDPVPPLAQMPSIQPAAMAKATCPIPVSAPLQCLHAGPGGHGRPLFRMLIPYAAYRAIALYGDAAREHVHRMIVGKTQSLNAALAARLLQLGLPAALETNEPVASVPPALMRASEQVQNDGGADALRRDLAAVEQLSAINRSRMRETGQMLATSGRSRAHDDPFHTVRADAPAHVAQLAATFKTYSEMLDAATASDAAVRRRWEGSRDSITLLCRPATDIAAAIPPAPRLTQASPASPFDAVRKLRSLLDDLEEVRAARGAIVRDAKAAVEADNVRPAVLKELEKLEHGGLASVGDVRVSQFDGLMEVEMRKYQIFDDMVEASELQQAALLARVEDIHASLIATRADDPLLEARGRFLQRLEVAARDFGELLIDLHEGLNFHNEYGKMVAQLQESVKRAVSASAPDLSSLAIAESPSTPTDPGQYQPEQHGPIRFR